MPSLISHVMRGMVSRGARRNNALALPELRASMERISSLIRPPRSVSVESKRVGELECEWLRPKRREPDKALLYLHGGAFCSGSAVTHRHLVGRIVSQVNAAALVPNYRLAPEHRYPAALEDSFACYRNLLDLGYSPDEIVVAGDSAGGNLTLVLMLYLREHSYQLPAAAVCLSPVVDLARSDEETKRIDAERAPKDPMIRLHFVAPMIDEYVGDSDPADPFLSPLFGDLSGLPPTLIQAGGDELLLTDARRFSERARQAGADLTLQVYDRMWHVWQVFAPYLPEARRAIRAISSFISDRVGIGAQVSRPSK